MKRFLIIIILAAPIFGNAQQLSLQDAVNLALKNSLDIQLAKNNVDITTINNSYGVAGGLPVVTGGVTDNEQVTSISQKYSDPARNNNSNNASSNTLSANVTGSFLLYNGMRVVAAKKRLEQLEQQSQQLLISQIQNTIAAVMTKYYDIVRQQSYIKTINQSIVVSQQRLDILKTQKEVGMANNADLFQSQLDLNALLQSQKSQQLVIDQAKSDLLTLLTLNADSAITVKDTIIVSNNVSLDSALTSLAKNPDLIAAAQQIRINEQLVKETAAQRYPSLRLNGGYNYNRNQNSAGFNLLNESYGPQIGVSLVVPIYNGSIYKKQQQVAEINTKNAAIQRQTLVRDYSASVVKTYQAYANALKQLETEQQNYDLANQLLQLVIQKFQLRQATIVDVKQAQQSFEDAGYRLVNLSYAAKSAEIELKRIANALTL